MIKNERQYRITKSQVGKFEHAIEVLEQTTPGNSESSVLLRQVQIDALKSQLTDLRQQVEEYEALKAGQHNIIQIESFDDLPQGLIRARIAAGLSQKDLADRLAMKEQQIQRYEATGYASASFERVKEVIRALSIHIREDIFLPSARLSMVTLIKRLVGVGLDRDFIINRLLRPSIIYEQDSSDTSSADSATALRAAAIVQRVFGWTPAEIFGDAQLHLDQSVSGITRFKVAARAGEKKLSAYTFYSHYLALLTLDASIAAPSDKLPVTWQEVHNGIATLFGSLTLESTLQYIWMLGIPVLPLKGSGAFHGACWRVEGRNIIVLKQQTRAEAKWIFDALHELWHAIQDPDKDEFELVETPETSDERRKSPSELAAGRFAGNVMLNGKANELAKRCLQLSSGEVERLKGVVPEVAEEGNVRADFLANYMAFRLTQDKVNWWPTASGFQAVGRDPWQVACDIFVEHINFGRLNPVDRDVLLQAVTDVE